VLIDYFGEHVGTLQLLFPESFISGFSFIKLLKFFQAYPIIADKKKENIKHFAFRMSILVCIPFYYLHAIFLSNIFPKIYKIFERERERERDQIWSLHDINHDINHIIYLISIALLINKF